MLKKCLVLINNPAVTVVKFDDKEVQLPSIHREASFVNVLFENGKYTVVADDYREPTKVEKKAAKKTTTDDEAKGDVKADAGVE